MAARKKVSVDSLFAHLHVAAEPARPGSLPTVPCIEAPPPAPAPAPPPPDGDPDLRPLERKPAPVVSLVSRQTFLAIERAGEDTFWVQRVRHNGGSRDAVLYTRDELASLRERISAVLNEEK